MGCPGQSGFRVSSASGGLARNDVFVVPPSHRCTSGVKRPRCNSRIRAPPFAQRRIMGAGAPRPRGRTVPRWGARFEESTAGSAPASAGAPQRLCPGLGSFFTDAASEMTVRYCPFLAMTLGAPPAALGSRGRRRTHGERAAGGGRVFSDRIEAPKAAGRAGQRVANFVKPLMPAPRAGRGVGIASSTGWGRRCGRRPATLIASGTRAAGASLGSPAPWTRRGRLWAAHRLLILWLAQATTGRLRVPSSRARGGAARRGRTADARRAGAHQPSMARLRRVGQAFPPSPWPPRFALGNRPSVRDPAGAENVGWGPAYPVATSPYVVYASLALPSAASPTRGARPW